MRPLCPSDLPSIAGWYAARGSLAPHPATLPPTGRIVPDVAAGFLYLTNSAVALLDGYVTNPAASLRARSAAVDSITAALLAHARREGVRHVTAICASAGIARRAAKFGLRPIGTYRMAAIAMGEMHSSGRAG